MALVIRGVDVSVYRQSRGLTVQELADAVGTDAASIEAVERTSVTHTTAPGVVRFAAALGVRPSDIAERR